MLQRGELALDSLPPSPPISFAKGLHLQGNVPLVTLSQRGTSQHPDGSGYHESVLILATLEGFWKHFQNLGAARSRQCVIALGLRRQPQLPGRGWAPGLGAGEDRTAFRSAADLTQGIREHLPQQPGVGTRCAFDNGEMLGEWPRPSLPSDGAHCKTEIERRHRGAAAGFGERVAGGRGVFRSRKSGLELGGSCKAGAGISLLVLAVNSGCCQSPNARHPSRSW